MNLKFKSIIYILIALTTFSCSNLDDDILDAIPAENFPENEAQAALITIPAYRELADLIDDAGWWFWAQEVTSDEIVFPVRHTDWEDGGKWKNLHSHQWNNSSDAVNSMWSHMFDGVFEANRAIEELLPADGSEPALSVKKTVAKLIALRSFYYYLLIDNYGDVPYLTSFSDAPEQPFTEDRAVIYEGIVTDLENNAQYLDVATNNFAVSKGMAYTLLAKLYINAAIYTGTPNWEKAGVYCDSVINLGKYNLAADPLQPFTAANENSAENIFTIPFDEDDLQGFRLHMRTLYYEHFKTYDMTAGPWNGFAAVEDHYNTFTDGDLRKAGFIVGPQFESNGTPLFDQTADTTVTINPNIAALVMDSENHTFIEIRLSGARVGKYEIAAGTGENLNNDFPLFRYADVLLMKAEAEIQQGKNGDLWVNQVRNRAGLQDWNGTTLEMLLEERGREMFCEGHRRQDLIRFGKFGNAWWEKAANGADRQTFPIPQWAIDANPNLGE